MPLPNELIKPIDEIKTASNRVLVICLILAVVSLSGLLIALYKIGNGYRSNGILAAKEETLYWREAYRIKDSALSECGRESLKQANKRSSNADLRTEITENIKKKIKIK